MKRSRAVCILALNLIFVVFYPCLASSQICPLNNLQIGQLKSKADDYLTQLLANHLVDGQLVSRRLNGSYSEEGDSATYTSLFIAAEAWRYKLTGDRLAYQNVEAGLETLHRLQEVTGGNGVIARFIPPGNSTPYIPTHSFTSKDVYTAVLFAYSNAFPILNDGPVREMVINDAQAIGNNLLANNFSIVGNYDAFVPLKPSLDLPLIQHLFSTDSELLPELAATISNARSEVSRRVFNVPVVLLGIVWIANRSQQIADNWDNPQFWVPFLNPNHPSWTAENQRIATAVLTTMAPGDFAAISQMLFAFSEIAGGLYDKRPSNLSNDPYGRLQMWDLFSALIDSANGLANINQVLSQHWNTGVTAILNNFLRVLRAAPQALPSLVNYLAIELNVPVLQVIHYSAGSSEADFARVISNFIRTVVGGSLTSLADHVNIIFNFIETSSEPLATTLESKGDDLVAQWFANDRQNRGILQTFVNRLPLSVTAPEDLWIISSHSLLLLHALKVLHQVTEDPAYLAHYDQLKAGLIQNVLDLGPAQDSIVSGVFGADAANALRIGGTHQLNWLALYDLLILDNSEPELSQLQTILHEELLPVINDFNSEAAFIHQAFANPTQISLQATVEGANSLYLFPNYGYHDFDYADPQQVPTVNSLFGGYIDFLNLKGTRLAIPLNLRPRDAVAWQRSPRRLTNGIRDHIFAGVDYLLAYWLGRKHNILDFSDLTPYAYPAVENLTANGANPSAFTQTNSFSIDWDYPASPFGAQVEGVYYKFFSPPNGPTDGTFTTQKPIVIQSPADGIVPMYVWVKDQCGIINHNNSAQVILKYHIPTTVYVDAQNSGPQTGVASQPFRQIQSAINASLWDDTISVQAGSYHESLVLKPHLNLQGAGMANTYIIGIGGQSVITIDHIGDSVRVAGFSISGGTTTRGGCINIDNSAPIIENNEIRNCYASYDGGGISSHQSQSVIRNNIIHHNNAWHGGGINCYENPGCGRIEGNIMYNNYGWGEGGGIYFGLDPSTEVINNLFYNNNSAAGGAIFVWDSATLIANNTMVANTGGNGGGVYAYFTASNIFLANNIIAQNVAGSRGGGVYAVPSAVSGIHHNDIWGNQAFFPGSEDTYGAPLGSGNISLNPNFLANPSLPFALSSSSPCIDSGNNSLATPTQYDLSGHQRIIDGDGNGSQIIDMGAYEYLPGLIALE